MTLLKSVYQEKLLKCTALLIHFRSLNEIFICMQIPRCFTRPWARYGEQRFDAHCCLCVQMHAHLFEHLGLGGELVLPPWVVVCCCAGLSLSCSASQCHDELQPMLIICCHLASGHPSETNERSHFFPLCCYNTSLPRCRQNPYYKLFYSVMFIMPPLLSLQHRTSR